MKQNPIYPPSNLHSCPYLPPLGMQGIFNPLSTTQVCLFHKITDLSQEAP